MGPDAVDATGEAAGALDAADLVDACAPPTGSAHALQTGARAEEACGQAAGQEEGAQARPQESDQEESREETKASQAACGEEISAEKALRE